MYFRKLLIANRGEIAVRIIRACHELDIAAVAVYSAADRQAMHVRMADEAVPIGPAAAAESYLRSERIVEAAIKSGAEAIHPGYGFLSERSHFARACQEAHVVFIGPPPDVIALMGSKIEAKRLAIEAGVPTAPAYLGNDQSPERLVAEAEQIGFPLLIKASAGGGGKGMRTVRNLDEFAPALAAAQREALAAFGDDAVLLERLIERPRHIEFQVLADAHGHCVHLFERECSIQRRHQKIIEESPSPALSANLRETLGAAVVRLAQRAGYINAGTVEFVVDPQGAASFLEMNTRLQVEHPITEAVTGYDLVQLQIAIAAGEPLPFVQADLHQRGHAIEARIYAEDSLQYLPSTGVVQVFSPSHGPGIRNDAGIASGDEVTINYDPMLAKLIVQAADRPAAIKRMQRALNEYAVLGVTTNLPLLQAVVAHPAFAAGDTTTDFLETQSISATLLQQELPDLVLLAAAILDTNETRFTADPWASSAWRLARNTLIRRYQVAGTERIVRLEHTGGHWHMQMSDLRWIVQEVVFQTNCITLALSQGETLQIERFVYARVGHDWLIAWRGTEYQLTPVPGLSIDALGANSAHASDANLAAPMPGTIIRVLVGEGEQVAANQPLIVLEAMKMEHVVVAPHAGIVRRLPYAVGALVAKGAALVELS